MQFQGRFGAPFILHERVAIEPLLARGDAALYGAKNNGRTCVEFDQTKAPRPLYLRQFQRLAKLLPRCDRRCHETFTRV